MSHVKGVTARVAHSCETCDRRTVNGDYTKAIRPGDRYLRHVVFPGDDIYPGLVGPETVHECASCAIARDDFAAHQYGICGSYCHGVQPCTLPLEKAGAGHGHTHACRGCDR